MRKYKFENYSLFLQATDKQDSYGHILVKYKFITPKKEVLFEGDDFGASPLHEPESRESAIALLGFLTLRKGDTDEEYFDNYTPAQLEFSQSFDCENLQLYTLDE
jgi:hypothetical protein